MAAATMAFSRVRFGDTSYPKIENALNVLAAIESGARDMVMLQWGNGALVGSAGSECLRLVGGSSAKQGPLILIKIF